MQTVESITPVIHRMSPQSIKLTDAQAAEIGRQALDSVANLSGDERAFQLALAILRLKNRI